MVTVNPYRQPDTFLFPFTAQCSTVVAQVPPLTKQTQYTLPRYQLVLSGPPVVSLHTVSTHMYDSTYSKHTEIKHQCNIGNVMNCIFIYFKVPQYIYCALNNKPNLIRIIVIIDKNENTI